VKIAKIKNLEVLFKIITESTLCLTIFCLYLTIMITPIENLPAATIGFTASDKVTGDDYEQIIIPQVEAALKEHGKLSMVYHLGPDFTGFDAAAVWDDAKLGFGHLTSWKRLAVVTDISWVGTGVKVAGFLMPCEVKLFSNTELSNAITWISEA